MKNTLRLISLLLAFILVLALASCEILTSFLPATDSENNESGKNDGIKDNAPGDGTEDDSDSNKDNEGDNPSDGKVEGDDPGSNEGSGEGDKANGDDPGNNEGSGEGDKANGDDPGSNEGPGDIVECNHVYANNICINCSKAYIDEEYANNCVHNWGSVFCTDCGARCDHKFDTTTCEYCGYVSAGIDNAITIHFDGAEIPIPYSATFFDVVALYMTFDTDVEMSFFMGEWAIEINGERKTVGAYESVADYGRSVWLVYLGESNPGGGDPGSNPLFVYTISIINDPAYVPFTIESDTPLSGEDIIQRAGITNPECFYIYVNTSELYDLDSFRLMIFGESVNIEFHLAG